MEQPHRTHTLKFQNHKIRTSQRDHKPWFVIADVCETLGIADSREALAYLTPDEKNVIEGREFNDHNMILSIISQSGLKRLILVADDPKAKAFSEWLKLSDIDNQNPGITEDVLSRVQALHLKALGKSNFQAIMETMQVLRDDHPKEYGEAMRYIDCTYDFLFGSMQEGL